MTEDQMQELASLYALGALGSEERKNVEECASANPVFAQLLRDLNDVTSRLSLATAMPSPGVPPLSLKSRICGQVDDRMPSVVKPIFHLEDSDSYRVPVVVTGPDLLVRWVSPAFTAMCGHALSELRGHRLGPILQGRDTDPAAVQRMREAIHAREPVTQEVLNYHKDGSAYMVSVSIQPVLGPADKVLCFVAREQKLD